MENKTTVQAPRTHAQTFCGMFQFQQGIFHNALESLTDEIALQRVAGSSNHLNWLLGHIVHCRFMLAGMIGLEEVNPFNKLYWSAIQERDYPGLADVVMEMNRISGKLLNQLATSTDESIFAEEAPGKPALAEIISFFAYHEAYHLGQIGLLRRLLGLSALKSHE